MSEPMTLERLAEIRARCEAATPGPWTVFDTVYSGYHVVFLDVGVAYYIHHLAAADFIAHARQDVPDLLAEVERSEARFWRVCPCGCVVSGTETTPCVNCRRTTGKLLLLAYLDLQAENKRLREVLRFYLELMDGAAEAFAAYGFGPDPEAAEAPAQEAPDA